MAKRWLIGGLAVGVGALAVAPEARTWLRRRLGLEPEDRRWFEEEGADAPEYEGDEPLDTREARFSLRARLSEETPAEAETNAATEAEAPPVLEVAPEPEPQPSFLTEVTPEPEPEPAPYLSEVPTAPEPDPEPTPFAASEPPAPEPWPRMAPPEAAPEPEPEPAQAFEPESTPFAPPAAAPAWSSYESVPAITPEADAPKTPGEDTDEVPPLPSSAGWEAPVEEPLTPPTELRPPPPPPSRPFSSEGASFRSAIDAARERVHGTAREATPDENDSEPGDKD